jgi:uncharacterized protein YbjT (DUF2867 family)
VTRLLLGDTRWARVAAIGRRPPAIADPALVRVEGDVLADGAWQDALEVDDVLCCLGTTIAKAGSQAAFRAVDLDAVVRVAAAARGRGAVQLLVVSSVGASAHARSFYLRTKGAMETAVSAAGFRCCQIFRPSLLLGPRAEARTGERIAAALMSPLGGLLGRYRPVHRDAVASAMVRVAAEAPGGVNVFESDAIAALAAGR